MVKLGHNFLDKFESAKRHRQGLLSAPTLLKIGLHLNEALKARIRKWRRQRGNQTGNHDLRSLSFVNIQVIFCTAQRIKLITRSATVITWNTSEVRA